MHIWSCLLLTEFGRMRPDRTFASVDTQLDSPCTITNMYSRSYILGKNRTQFQSLAVTLSTWRFLNNFLTKHRS